MHSVHSDETKKRMTDVMIHEGDDDEGRDVCIIMNRRGMKQRIETEYEIK